jgi:hypothetical protein
MESTLINSRQRKCAPPNLPTGRLTDLPIFFFTTWPNSIRPPARFVDIAQWRITRGCVQIPARGSDMYGSADIFSLLFRQEMESTRWPYGHGAIVAPRTLCPTSFQLINPVEMLEEPDIRTVHFFRTSDHPVIMPYCEPQFARMLCRHCRLFTLFTFLYCASI